MVENQFLVTVNYEIFLVNLKRYIKYYLKIPNVDMREKYFSIDIKFTFYPNSKYNQTFGVYT